MKRLVFAALLLALAAPAPLLYAKDTADPKPTSSPAKKKKRRFFDPDVLSKDRSQTKSEKPYEKDPDAPKKKGLNLGKELGKDRSQDKK